MTDLDYQAQAAIQVVEAYWQGVEAGIAQATQQASTDQQQASRFEPGSGS